jgi:hypothetical protein
LIPAPAARSTHHADRQGEAAHARGQQKGCVCSRQNWLEKKGGKAIEPLSRLTWQAVAAPLREMSAKKSAPGCPGRPRDLLPCRIEGSAGQKFTTTLPPTSRTVLMNKRTEPLVCDCPSTPPAKQSGHAGGNADVKSLQKPSPHPMPPPPYPFPISPLFWLHDL